MPTLRPVVLIFLFILSIHHNVSAQQKTEFLLVGVMHEIPDSLSCNWKSSYQKLLRYKPDQIAVEYVPPRDSASQKFFLGQNYRHIWDSVLVAWEGSRISPADSIDRYFKKVSKNNDIVDRISLWKYYHLQTDIANKDYQSYLIYLDLDKATTRLTPESTLGKIFWPRHRNYVKAKKNSEFFNLVFPLARHYKINYLFPTDYRVTFPEQSDAYVKFTEELADTPDLKKYEAFWAEFAKNDSDHVAACSILEYCNSRAWIEKSDYGQAKILAHTGNTSFSRYAQVWYKRNSIIADNVIAVAKQSNAKRMVVFYGNIHTAPLKKILEEKGYTVKLLEDIK